MSKRPEILSVAQQLFGRHGLKKVTTDDIARQARVSKATIYKFYANKQEILKEVVRLEMEELATRIRTAVAGEETVEGKLRAHLVTKLTTVHDLINLYNVSHASMAEHWVHARVLQDQLVQEEAGLLRDILDQGLATGELDVVNVEATAHFMVVSLQALEYPWAVDGLNLTVRDQVDLMLDILLNGLRKRA